MDADADEIDFPVQWGNFIKFQLASILGEEFNVPDAKMDRLVVRSEASFRNVKAQSLTKTSNRTPIGKVDF